MRVTGERREALLAEFERSAMTGRKFASWAGIKYSTFSNWLRSRRKRQSPPSPGAERAPSTRWLEAVVSASADPKAQVKSKTGVLVVEAAGGVRIEIADEAQVKLAAHLLRELGRERGC
jgi:transposase